MKTNKAKRVRVRAYAVCCGDGDIHDDGDYTLVCQDKGDALDYLSEQREYYTDGADVCGPHQLVELSGWAKVKEKR